MDNYEFLTGPFCGSIVAEGTQVLDVPWDQLPEDLQAAALEWADSQNRAITDDKAELIESWECSWDSCPTDEAVTLKSMSEWTMID
jgi:hypothetical protein